MNNSDTIDIQPPSHRGDEPNMSSTPGIKPIPASKPAPIPLPQAKPTEILHDQYSFLASNLHAVILLSGLVLSFNRLVENPIATLAKLSPLVIILQLAYCFLCLPSTGQAPPPPKQKWKKQSKPTQDFGARAVVCVEKEYCITQTLIVCF